MWHTHVDSKSLHYEDGPGNNDDNKNNKHNYKSNREEW